MAPLNPHEAGMMKPGIYELAKVLLYLNLADAERTPLLARTQLLNRLRPFGKLTASRRERLALVYDRTLIGPLAIPDAAPVAAGENAERTVRPHWRRGHFRHIRYEEGHRQSRIDWIRPTLVNAAGAFKAATVTPVPPPPEGERFRQSGVAAQPCCASASAKARSSSSTAAYRLSANCAASGSPCRPAQVHQA